MLANNHIMASLEEGVNFFCLFIFFKKEDHLKNGDISVYTNKIRPAAVLRRGQACVWEALFGWALRQCLRWPCWWWAHNFVCVCVCAHVRERSIPMWMGSNELGRNVVWMFFCSFFCCAQKEKYLVNHSCFSPSIPLCSRHGALQEKKNH